MVPWIWLGIMCHRNIHYYYLRMYFKWSLYTLYFHVCQVRVTGRGLWSLLSVCDVFQGLINSLVWGGWVRACVCVCTLLLLSIFLVFERFLASCFIELLMFSC